MRLRFFPIIMKTTTINDLIDAPAKFKILSEKVLYLKIGPRLLVKKLFTFRGKKIMYVVVDYLQTRCICFFFVCEQLFYQKCCLNRINTE